MNTITKETQVGDLVAHDYRTATVFKNNKIDFCCKGNRSIEEVCNQQNIQEEPLIEELNAIVSSTDSTGENFQNWDLDLLVDYIEKKHHRYVRSRIPELLSYIEKVARVHGERHPELIEIRRLFFSSAQDLASHMQKEENILFPYIKKLVSEDPLEKPAFGSAVNPIQMMKSEHDNEGERFRAIARLSQEYTPPEDACTTYRVAFAMLKEFEEDLHKHIHLENNILFPRAIKAEKNIKQQTEVA